MIKAKINVELLFLEWEELSVSTVIIYNALMPWLGFNLVSLYSIENDLLRIKTKEIAFNDFTISKEEYLRDYFITDNLMWHRKEIIDYDTTQPIIGWH